MDLPKNTAKSISSKSHRYSVVEWGYDLKIRYLDDCATPQLDTVTLQPAPYETVTILPMSCCCLAT